MSGPLDDPNHEQFAVSLACGVPYASAYIDSGFGCTDRSSAYSRAWRLLRRPDIAARVEELKAEAGDVLQDQGVTRSWLMQILERNIRIASGIEPYTLESVDGKMVQRFRQDFAAANKAVELLGRLINEFKNEHKIDPLTINSTSVSVTPEMLSTMDAYRLETLHGLIQSFVGAGKK